MGNYPPNNYPPVNGFEQELSSTVPVIIEMLSFSGRRDIPEPKRLAPTRQTLRARLIIL